MTPTSCRAEFGDRHGYSLAMESQKCRAKMFSLISSLRQRGVALQSGDPERVASASISRTFRCVFAVRYVGLPFSWPSFQR